MQVCLHLLFLPSTFQQQRKSCEKSQRGERSGKLVGEFRADCRAQPPDVPVQIPSSSNSSPSASGQVTAAEVLSDHRAHLETFKVELFI